MATSVEDLNNRTAFEEQRAINDYKIWQVIGASAAGTMIEWYDFYIFGSLTAVISGLFYPPEAGVTLATIMYLSTFAVGFLVRPFGAVFFGADWRFSRTQIRFSGDAADHGRRDGGDWLAANLCQHRHPRSRFVARDSHFAGVWPWEANTAGRRFTWPSMFRTSDAVITRVLFKLRRRSDFLFRSRLF